MNVMKINKPQFDSTLKRLNVEQDFLDSSDLLYDIYETVTEAIETVLKQSEFKEFNFVNPIVVLLYILNEIKFAHSIRWGEKVSIEKMLQDEDFYHYLCSVICDKYLTNEQLNYKSQAYLNKFNPQISTMALYLNFCLNILNRQNVEYDKYQRLIKDMLKNSFSLSQCIQNLLINGFDVEAFSTWRTTHENESILYVLVLNGKDVFDAYFRHIEYSLAYRGQIKSKEKTDEIFAEIKEKMKEKGLKSKDMKKFIEYGYLFAIKDKEYLVDYKLNFRDGVENMAGLKKYSKIYELSSEIAHSSPLLIYSNREYYFLITMINLYESFFRLESVFNTFYKEIATEEEYARYLNLRNVYMNELLVIHKSLNLQYVNKFVKIKTQHHDNKNPQ